MIAATLAGAALIAVVIADLVLTVLHPTRSGALSRVAMAATWRCARALADTVGSEVVVSYTGPLMMLAQLVTWVLGLWIGFALIYLGHMGQIGAPGIGPEDHGLLDALYLSGSALTTVGFGDLVARTDALRLITVAEAASGLAVITAAIAYLLAVYPLVSQIRVTARQLAPARDDRGAAELVFHGGSCRLEALQRELIQLDESTQRFPVLYYFHAEDQRASLATAVRGTSLIAMQLSYGLPTQAVPHARWHGRELERTLARVIEHFEARFYGRVRDARDPPAADSTVDRRLQELRRTAAEVTGVDADEEPEREGLARLLARSDFFLAELGRRHLYPHEPF